MIGPVFGLDKNRLEIPCGIIQFINKKEMNGEKDIGPKDVERFK
tara:strand:+ start:1373 stop:1504 length:132 start_codon:yes stop_codon:yes gene_type:complete